MSPLVNGRNLGVAQNGRFNSSNTDPIPGGRLWIQAAATWNAMRRAYIAAGGEPWEFMPAGPNSSARSRSAQDYFWTHQPPPAARPYTSNHGWGIAVDVKTRRAAAWLMTHAAKYGWSWDEGRRVGEWWHWRYVGLSAAAYRAVTKTPDLLGHLTRTERRLVKELDRLRHEHKDLPRRRVLVADLRKRAAEIQRLARAERNGWDKANRSKRFRTLRSRLV